VPPQWPGDFAWNAARDLLSTGPADRCFAVEIDGDGIAHLRFGDGLNGIQPDAGWRFRVRQRVGNGPAGNVGHDSIGWISHKTGPLSGMNLTARNPFAASGGTAPESIEEVKLYAPYAYGRILERAVAAADYAQLAADDPRVQGAFAELAWTGSWYEASVALDAVARYTVEEVVPGVSASLRRARRIGHDLRIVAARRVPLDIELAICIEADHLRGDVEKAVRAILSSGILPDGSLGMFHPDELQFGADAYGSPIVAAVQAIDGVVHVELTRFARFYAGDADAVRSLEDNVIAIARDEIAQLDGDANFPERGRLTLDLKGGR
jgi:predicted phage baseplate assembly protein